jgi:alpha-L-arabinofuranosidase
LHYYAVPYGWNDPRGKGSATKFNEQEYFIQMKNALFMDEMVTKHTAIMDKYDPAKKIAFSVDEWGAWYDVDPGSNPGFLFQQNTLRDAMLCAATMNIFHKHSDRVRMANIAQMVNVLQSLVMTKDDKMILTPTYWVYDMYKVHQDAENLPVEINSPLFYYQFQNLPALSVSASKDKNGAIHVSLVNIDPKNDIDASCALIKLASAAKVVSGKIITSSNVADCNTFVSPNTVGMADFKGAKVVNGSLKLTVPAKSIITIEIK